MIAKNKFLLAWLCFQLPVLAYAGTPDSAGASTSGSESERYARRCQPQAAYRTVNPQGTMLWGTRRSWDTEKSTPQNTSVLVSVRFTSSRQPEVPQRTLQLEGGHLVVSSAPGTQEDGRVVGSVLQGLSSDGKPVEVAICDAEPSRADPGMVFYRIEAWNSLAQEWENPCVASAEVPHPRALAVGGLWDATGAHSDAPDRFTFACETGAITKCIGWGYKPWSSRDGQSLANLHQACTRMARADYCGNGVSHTHQNTLIDMYDRFGVSTRTTESSETWDVKRGSFEAAWAPDGAACLARTRDSRPLTTILRECPQRFHVGPTFDLGEGDRCSVVRSDLLPATAVLRNRSYGSAPGITPVD